jgi:sensor histidine kinase YesM
MLLSNGLYWLVAQRHYPWTWPIATADVLLTVSAYASLFYVNWRVLIPRYLARPDNAHFLGVLLLALGTTFIVRTISISLLHLLRFPFPSAGSLAYRIGLYYGQTVSTAGGGVAITALLVLLLSFYLRLSTDYQHEQRQRQAEEQRRQALEKQHLAAELSLLKAQLNPHFLFNTLNNIYSLTSAESPEAPAAVAVLQLAELMRYQLYESTAELVPLAQEVAHLQSFLNLQRLRLPVAEALQFSVPATLPAHFTLAPMLLLPLVENACKHGDLAQRPCAVELALHLHAESLTFTVRNGIRRAVYPGPQQPGGVGLANLRRRLLLLYPQRHTLQVESSDTHYHVTLTLQLATQVA